MAKRARSKAAPQKAPSSDGLATSVYNRRRKVSFGTLVKNGWFSATPDDTDISRAIRTNNPGALNVSTWQRTRPGFVGQTPAHAAGNITAIYRIPEQGIAAWYFLLFDPYGFGETGQFDLASLARKYAGQNASPAKVKAYTEGWSKWSNGALQLDTVIHFALDEELLDFAKAEFAHEAGAVSPLHDDQILYGFCARKAGGLNGRLPDRVTVQPYRLC
jgi:D-alanyl-D-alanine carboxypeptidase